MRVKDESRLRVINDIRVHAIAILTMANEYKTEYKDDHEYPVRVKMDNLDSIWDVINFNIRELVRKVEPENKP